MFGPRFLVPLPRGWDSRMLEARRLSKSFSRIFAVSELSFAVQPGQVLGLLGPNGSGKSTTVNILAGLLQPTTGDVLFEGESIRDNLTGYKRRLGYVLRFRISTPISADVNTWS